MIQASLESNFWCYECHQYESYWWRGEGVFCSWRLSRCSVLQCLVVWRSVLQCVAVTTFDVMNVINMNHIVISRIQVLTVSEESHRQYEWLISTHMDDLLLHIWMTYLWHHSFRCWRWVKSHIANTNGPCSFIRVTQLNHTYRFRPVLNHDYDRVRDN